MLTSQNICEEAYATGEEEHVREVLREVEPVRELEELRYLFSEDWQDEVELQTVERD